MLLTLFVFLLVLSVLVLVHELGHFLAAKKAGIKIEEFGFGLPPRIFSKKIGGTIYSLNLLPIGGFVKLYGEDEEDQPQKAMPFVANDSRNQRNRAFYAQPKLTRAIVLCAGVFMNAVFASLIFYLFLSISNFKTEIPLLFNHQFFAVSQTNKSEIIINNIAKNSPAEKTGIKEFSKVLSFNGQNLKDAQVFTKLVEANKGKEISLKFQDLKSYQIYEVKVIPRVSPPKNEGAIGISFSPMSLAVLEYKTLPQKLFSGVTYAFNMMLYNFEVLGKLVAISFTEKSAAPVGEAVSGPAGIYTSFSQIVQIASVKERILQILNFIGLISISLAFFNILPFPALDGGRLLFVVIEGLIGKKIKPVLERVTHQIGMVILLGLILLVTVNDILRIFHK